EVEERERQASGVSPRPRVRIGTVRYSSSIRRRTARDEGVPVKVNVEDFIALKTAVFGMTRLGKSNTMKTIATAVFRHAAETGRRIGQLLFDPAGEYANPNQQDQTALAQLGPECVTIFRFGAQSNEPGVRPLSTHFLSDKAVEVTWSIISSVPALVSSERGDLTLTAGTLIPFWTTFVTAREAISVRAAKARKESQRPRKPAKGSEEAEDTGSDKEAIKLEEEFIKWVDTELDA